MTVSDTAAPAGLDPELRAMVLDTIRQLRKKLLTKERVLEWDKHEHFPEEAIRAMLGPEIGLQLVFIPEEYGGMGGGARDSCAVTRETSRICLGISTAFFALQLGSDPILVGGTEPQKAKWLGRIAEGQSIVAYAVTEPGAGSNLAALKTKAEPVRDGDGNITAYKLTGAKQFISNGGYADIITVLANTPDGPAFFVVEKGLPGLTQGKHEEKHGIRASNTAPVILEEVLVPAENLIGNVPGEGLKQANEVFGYTRLMVAAMALGAAEEALDIASAYAKERIQFGTPLSEKQGYTHKLIVPNVVRLLAGAVYIDEVGLRFDSGETGLLEEGSIAKYFVTTAANRAADDSVQALGGYGYINEYMVEKIRRDVRITSIYEGTSEIQQNIISLYRWKKTWKTKGEFYTGLATELDAIHQRTDDIGAGYCACAARILNAAILAVQQHKLTKSQHVMFALADMVAAVEVNAALIRRAAAEPDSARLRLASRIFTGETAALVRRRVEQIFLGDGSVGWSEFATFRAASGLDELIPAAAGATNDMDALADIVFERAAPIGG